jgi:hypothetical protein
MQCCWHEDGTAPRKRRCYCAAWPDLQRHISFCGSFQPWHNQCTRIRTAVMQCCWHGQYNRVSDTANKRVHDANNKLLRFVSTISLDDHKETVSLDTTNVLEFEQLLCTRPIQSCFWHGQQTCSWREQQPCLWHDKYTRMRHVYDTKNILESVGRLQHQRRFVKLSGNEDGTAPWARRRGQLRVDEDADDFTRRSARGPAVNANGGPVTMSVNENTCWPHLQFKCTLLEFLASVRHFASATGCVVQTASSSCLETAKDCKN